LSRKLRAATAVAGLKAFATVHLATGTIGGEVLDRLAGSDVDEDGVDLHEAAGLVGPQIARQSHGVVAFGCPAMRLGPATQRRHGDDDAALHETCDDAADRGVGSAVALRAQQRTQLGTPPHGIVEPQPLDLLHEGAAPASRALPERPA